MDNNRIDRLFNIVLVGSLCAGKSSFMTRYTKDMVRDEYRNTIGIDFDVKYIISSNTSSRIKLTIWDTSGDERFKTVTTSYYRGAHGFFIIFDVTNRDSFNKVPGFLKDIENHSTCATNPIKIILIAAKIDLAVNRQVSFAEAKQLADQLGIPYIETSAKENININEAFQQIAMEIEASITDIPPAQIKVSNNSTAIQNLRCCLL